jgi:hypothetical protein
MENDPGKKEEDNISFYLFAGLILIFLGLFLPVRLFEDTFFGLEVEARDTNIVR